MLDDPTLFAHYDWNRSGLDPPDRWDPALKSAVLMISAATTPMAVMVGPEGLLIPNSATEALIGPSAGGSVFGRSVMDVHSEIAPFYRSVLARVEGGASLSFAEQPLSILRDGEKMTAWFNLEFIPITGRGGKAIAVLGISSEITQLVARNRALSDSAARLHLALENSGMVGLWSLEVATNKCSCDANVARLFNLSPIDAEHGADVRQFLEAIHPGDRDYVSQSLATAVDSSEPYHCKYRVVAPSGEIRWAIASGKPTFDEEGRFERLLGVVVDITGQMETAAALADSRFRFETLTEALPQIVWSCDDKGHHDYFSRRWSEFTGIAQEEITEETWKTLVHPEDQETVARVWGHAMRHGTPYDLDYRFRHHSGEFRWLKVMALPIRDETGAITRWFGTSTDMHDAYRIAEEREAFAQKLEFLATHDQLTDMLNRAAFVNQASSILDQASGDGHAISLMMLDIDHFKMVNDTLGHPVGDKVLTTVARRIQSCLKRRDVAGRVGGEEFAVLLRHCSAEQSQIVAERIRRAVCSSPIYYCASGTLDVTISVGVTSTKHPADNLDWLLGVADRALYQAKEGGRNRAFYLAG